MRKGLSKIIWGLVISLIGAFIPVLGVPLILIGIALMMWGTFQFMFGAGAGAVKGAGKIVGTESSKRGSGKL